MSRSFKQCPTLSSFVCWMTLLSSIFPCFQWKMKGVRMFFCFILVKILWSLRRNFYRQNQLLQDILKCFRLLAKILINIHFVILLNIVKIFSACLLLYCHHMPKSGDPSRGILLNWKKANLTLLEYKKRNYVCNLPLQIIY